MSSTVNIFVPAICKCSESLTQKVWILGSLGPIPMIQLLDSCIVALQYETWIKFFH